MLGLVVALLVAVDGGSATPPTPAASSDDDELIENLELLTQLKDVEDLDVVLELDEPKKK